MLIPEVELLEDHHRDFPVPAARLVRYDMRWRGALPVPVFARKLALDKDPINV